MAQVKTQDSIYNEIYSGYYKKVLNYLRSIVGEYEAEDLTQEVFIKVHNNLDTLLDQSKISSWIYTIALNTARDRMKQKTNLSVSNGQTISFDSESGEMLIDRLADTKDKSPADKLIRKEMIECYVNLVDKLPENYYEIYILSEFDRLTDKEISEKLSLPVETVKIRLHRARKKLYADIQSQCHCFHNEHGEILAAPNKKQEHK